MHIFIDRLRKENTQLIEEEFPPSLLDTGEPELLCTHPIKVKGKAYLTEDHLILQLDITAQVSIPCIICNTPFLKKIHISSFYNTQPLEELSTPIFDCTPLIRETILLEIPPYAECHEGKCPERLHIQKYLVDKKEDGDLQ